MQLFPSFEKQFLKFLCFTLQRVKSCWQERDTQFLKFLCLTFVAESEELLAVKRLKLDYEDLVSVSADLQRRWEAMLEAVNHGTN